MNRNQTIKELQQRFPGIKGIRPGEELGYGAGSIFLGDVAEGGTINDLPACDYYAFEFDPKETIYIMGVHRELHTFLEQRGWHVEPYDPGTYLAYN